METVPYVMPLELRLGNSHGLVEIVVGQLGVEEFVAVGLEVGRPHAAWSRLPTVKEQDFHRPLHQLFLIGSMIPPPVGSGQGVSSVP